MQSGSQDIQPSQFFSRLSKCQKKIPWTNLSGFDHDLSLKIQGDFVVFTILFLEEDEASDWTTNSPSQEHRVKTLLQGLVYSLYQLLTEWALKTAPLLSEENDDARSQKISELKDYLNGIIGFYQGKKLAHVRNQGLRDSEGIFWAIRGENERGEVTYFCLKDVVTRLEAVFK